jgi:hypothetical protein
MDERWLQRRRWRTLSDREKSLRLAELRRRQQAQVEYELRMLAR